MEGREIVVREENYGMSFVMTADEAAKQVQELQRFVKNQMKEGSDYGIIPGTGDKPTLLKPGAEKLTEIYGLAPLVEIVGKIEDFDKPLFDYTVKVTLVKKNGGYSVAEGIGSCNSMESKYRYRWVFESQLPRYIDRESCQTKDINTRRGRVKLYRIENDDIFSLKNTILKMAKKRALIDAVLSATRSSGIFTQDMDDLVDDDVLGDMAPPGQRHENDRQEKQNSKGKSKRLVREQALEIKNLYEELELNKEDMMLIMKEVCKRPVDSVAKITFDEAIKVIEILKAEKYRRESLEEQGDEDGYDEGYNDEGQGE